MPLIISVDGVPFTLIEDADGFYVYAVGCYVQAAGSPLIVVLDTPLAKMTTNFGDVYQAIKSKLP